MWTWGDVWDELQRHPPGFVVSIPRDEIDAPELHGARPSWGWPAGQSSDLRFPPEPDCRGLHVQGFPGQWHAHLDAVHPRCGLVPHLRHDAPKALYTAGTTLGALVGGIAARSLGGLAFGGAGGLALALLVQALRAPRTFPPP